MINARYASIGMRRSNNYKMHNAATILPLTAHSSPLTAKETLQQSDEAEKQFIDLLSAIIVDIVLNKVSYEKEMHHIPALQ
jgi:hypothetical protein